MGAPARLIAPLLLLMRASSPSFQADEADLLAQEVPADQDGVRLHYHLSGKPTGAVSSLQLDRMTR